MRWAGRHTCALEACLIVLVADRRIFYRNGGDGHDQHRGNGGDPNPSHDLEFSLVLQ
jgi:hypothetical protein